MASNTDKADRVDPSYFADITGKKEIINYEDLIKENGLASLIPDNAQKYLKQIDEDEERGIHNYLCNLDKAEEAGQKQQCKAGKYKSDNDKLIRNDPSYGWIEFDDGRLFLFGDLKGQIKLPPTRVRIANGLTGDRLNKYLTNQVKELERKRQKRTYYSKSIKIDRDKQSKLNRQNHIDAVNGVKGKSIGQRAILFNEDGTVLRGANAIRDRAIGLEMSSQIPSERINDGKPIDNIKKGKERRTSKHPNRKGLGETNDIFGGLAALGGVAGLMAIMAFLVPMHLLTSAIAFLTSITTFFTNVRNVVTTYLSITDGIMALFGYKGSGDKIKKFAESMLDNVFGKERVDEAKTLFAKGLNSIAVGTKLLERIQMGRNMTLNRVDEVAYSLGSVNNILKDSGVIPEDSPYMQQSKAIEEFVEKRSQDDPELKENINFITGEMKTREQSEALIKEEEAYNERNRKFVDKQINDSFSLIDKTKTNAEAVIEDKL
jgi:hypothetical protein